MEKQTSDEYSSRLSNYDKLVLGDPSILEMAIPRMSNPQLIEFYEYCQEKVEAEEDKCELYWYATLFLEETQVVKMYRDGQLYVDTTLAESIDPVLVEETLTEEDMAQINSIVELINQRKKEKRNPLRRLIRNIKGR
jgi:hypothetical protein